MKREWTFWIRNLCGASVGLAAMFFATSGFGQAVPAVPAVPAIPAVEPAKDAVEPVKDAVEPAKDAVNDAADTAKDAVEPAKDAAKDATNTARDAVKGATDAAKDATQPLPGAARDAARDARDTVRDTIRETRDTIRDARGAVNGSLNASANARANLRWQDMQSADLGLWFNRNASNGLVVADLAAQGPIANLGFQEGDRIVSVAGQPITRQADFMRYLFTSNVAGGRVPVIITRGGQQQTIYMQPQSFLTHVNTSQHDPLEQIGLVADDRVQNRAVVWKVIPRSPAYYAGVRSGDLIVSFNKQPITTAAGLKDLAAKAQAGSIDLQVQRGDRTRDLQVDFQGPQVEARSALRPDYNAADNASASLTPVLDQAVPAVPAARGYYNNSYGRRGLFRGRR